MKKAVVIIICLINIVTVLRVYNEGKADSAWWVTARFQPTDDMIESIRVEEIDPSWEKATVLSHEILPEEAKSDPSQLEGPGKDFRIEGDFNEDGKKDIALVGVYRDKGGELGGFILILTRVRSGRLQKTFLLKYPGYNGFLKLWNDKKELILSFCMHCDAVVKIVWTKDGYELEHWAKEVFFKSVQGGDFAEVKRLIEEGADVNVGDRDEGSALMVASRYGQTEVVKLLIEEGADVNAQNDSRFTALMWASLRGHTEIVKLLIEEGADVNTQTATGPTALKFASRYPSSNAEVIKLLIEAGAKE